MDNGTLRTEAGASVLFYYLWKGRTVRWQKKTEERYGWQLLAY